MYRLIEISAYQAKFKKFIRKHPDLRGRLGHIYRDMQTDPFQPHLRLHALHGIHQGKQAVSVTQKYRIVLVARITEKEIILYDIGTHDDVYR